ncbi:GTPase [Pasteuria penetrans]|uniref:GTPase n=1 Tax=Pasteuria penetrans TaxID=86005 RepID=UPI0011EC3A03|nr:GTPase [Pasteuria penetrans]
MSSTDSPPPPAPHCPGCGALLQPEDPQQPGYVVPHVLRRFPIVCQRCYRLRHYGVCSSVEHKSETCWQNIVETLCEDGLVLHLVDLLDIPGSWIPNLASVVGRRRLWLIGNKMDLLPTRTFPTRVQGFLYREARKQGLRPEAIHLCSARMGLGMGRLRRLLWEPINGKKICVVGTTNVGKSTWINRLLAPDSRPSLSVSAYPGTTLGNVVLPWGKGGLLCDTPGMVRPDRVSEWLPAADAAAIVPSEALRVRIHHLAAGQMLFLGGVVRFEVQMGQRQPCMVCVSNRLPVHRTKQERADELWIKHRGSLLAPPYGDVVEEMTWRTVIFTISGGKRTDLVISGLGWITVGYSPAQFILRVPQGISVDQRPSIVGKVEVGT